MRILPGLLFILLSTSALSTCEQATSTPAEETPAASPPGEIVISRADASPDRGQAEGPHRLSFSNYPASEILRKVATSPIDYTVATDRP